jgi:SAM-dependent methyltransferase
MAIENIEKFIGELARSLHEETFVKLTLGNYKGADAHLQKILVRLVETKRGTRLFFLFRYDTRDTAKNFDFTEGVAKVRESLGKDFFAGHLFTTENDFQIDIGKKEKSRLNTAKQINKFVETLSKLFANSLLKDRRALEIVDMGSGKGYLTFATYDYFKNTLNLDVKVTGVDTKDELVSLCNDIAKSCDFNDLQFVHGWIGDYDLQDADILIALHACNTATDDAIFKGIRASADLIVCSPCCHQEIRPQIKPPALLKDILKHGVMLEREAEIITDGMRALLLEKSGYATKIFEFIATEHTPKNNMIVGTRQNKTVDAEKYEREIADLKNFYGIEEQRLESLLKTVA